MKQLLIIISILSGLNSYAQKDSLHIFEHIDFCDYDTTINYLSNKNLIWIDSSLNKFNYEFEEGDKNYFQISIKSKNCKCKDCSSHRIIIVQYTPTDSLDIIELNPKNTVWMNRNVWRVNPLETEFSGELDLNNRTLTIYKVIPEQSEIKFDELKINNILLTKPKLH